MASRLLRATAPAPEARAFYYWLQAHGARRRPAPWWTTYLVVAAPLAAVLVIAGAFVDDTLVQSNLWGFAGALLLWPALLWVMPETLLLFAYLHQLDAEGWRAAERNPWDRSPTQQARATLRDLKVRYRLGRRAVVKVGVRTLALRRLRLDRDGVALVATDPRDGSSARLELR